MEGADKLQEIVQTVLECQIEDGISLWEYDFDSLKAIRIIVEIETEYGVEIPNELLAIEYWDSIEKIKQTLQNLTSQN